MFGMAIFFSNFRVPLLHSTCYVTAVQFACIVPCPVPDESGRDCHLKLNLIHEITASTFLFRKTNLPQSMRHSPCGSWCSCFQLIYRPVSKFVKSVGRGTRSLEGWVLENGPQKPAVFVWSSALSTHPTLSLSRWTKVTKKGLELSLILNLQERSGAVNLEQVNCLLHISWKGSMSSDAPGRGEAGPGLSASAPSFTPGSTTGTTPGSSARRRRGQSGGNGEDSNSNRGRRGSGGRSGNDGRRGAGASPAPVPASPTATSGGHPQTAPQEVCTMCHHHCVSRMTEVCTYVG